MVSETDIFPALYGAGGYSERFEQLQSLRVRSSE